MSYDVTGKQKFVRPRRRRHLLQPADGRHGLRDDRAAAHGRAADALLRPPAGHQLRQRAGGAAHTVRVRVRRHVPEGLRLQRRRAAAVAVALGARRLVRRHAEPQPAHAEEHQRARLRRGLPAAEPGPDASPPARSPARPRCRWTSCARTRATATSSWSTPAPTPTTTRCRRRSTAGSRRACCSRSTTRSARRWARRASICRPATTTRIRTSIGFPRNDAVPGRGQLLPARLRPAPQLRQPVRVGTAEDETAAASSAPSSTTGRPRASTAGCRACPTRRRTASPGISPYTLDRHAGPRERAPRDHRRPRQRPQQRSLQAVRRRRASSAEAPAATALSRGRTTWSDRRRTTSTSR